MLTDLQKKAAQAIVNIYETGRPEGDYGMVTLLPGDPGHLTYGRAQTTLASGNLYILIKAYCEASDAKRAPELKNYLVRLANRDASLDYNTRLRSLLREAGDDPVMQDVQDTFRKLIGEERWSLNLPFYVRKIKIDEEVLGERPVRVSA